MPSITSDSNGVPVEFYHGSHRDMLEFSAVRYDGVGGAYFTTSKQDAADYADMVCIEEGDVPTIMTAHLRLDNPFRMHGTESQEISLTRIAELKSQGYDGVIGVTDQGEDYEYVVFDPDQIAIISCDPILIPSPAARL